MNKTITIQCVTAAFLALCFSVVAEDRPYQVQYDALFVEFDMKKLEKAAQAESGAAPSSEKVLASWEKGKGRLLNSFKLRTRSGVASSMETVQEIIYATEYRVSDKPKGEEDDGNILYPTSFETREIGTILNITPTVGPNQNLVDITMSMEISAGPEWVELKSTATSASGDRVQTTVQQPVFKSRNLSTSLLVQDGTTTVLGGLTDKDSDQVVYLLLTTTLVDAAGERLAAAP